MKCPVTVVHSDTHLYTELAEEGVSEAKTCRRDMRLYLYISEARLLVS